MTTSSLKRSRIVPQESDSDGNAVISEYLDTPSKKTRRRGDVDVSTSSLSPKPTELLIDFSDPSDVRSSGSNHYDGANSNRKVCEPVDDSGLRLTRLNQYDSPSNSELGSPGPFSDLHS